MVGAGLTTSTLAASTAASAPATMPELDGAQKAMLMFILLAVVLGAFLLTVVATILVRRIRRRQPQPNQPVNLPDPWVEAARRIEPYDGDRQ